MSNLRRIRMVIPNPAGEQFLWIIQAVSRHSKGACIGSMILSKAAALDVLRMAVESIDSAPGFGAGAEILQIPAGTLVP